MTQIYNFDGYFIDRNKFVSLDVCTTELHFIGIPTNAYKWASEREIEFTKFTNRPLVNRNTYILTYIHTYYYTYTVYSIHIPHHAGLPPPRAPSPYPPRMYISRCSLIVKACYMHICICNYIPSEYRAHLQVHIFICFPAYRRYRPLLFSRPHQRREQRR